MPMSYNPEDRHFSDVLHVTNAETDQWFIPGNNNEGDNPNSGTMANRLDDCESLTGLKQDGSTQMGKAVQPNTLNDW